MQKHGLSILTFGTALGALLFGTGCYSLSGDCEFNYNCDGGGGSGAGGTTGTGGAPPGCIPSNNSAPVGNECGLFVSSSKGEDQNAGTKEKPVATLVTAINLAKGKPIYICAEDFVESVEINENVIVYGGLDCKTDWSYTTVKPSVIGASSDQIPLRVHSKSAASIHDVTFKAEDAQVSGGSSIGIIAEGESSLTMERCRVEAGNGANGADGMAFTEPATEGDLGVDGLNACTANQVVTLDPPVTGCTDTDSSGGLGGIGSAAQGGAGAPGLPEGSMNAGVGEGTAVCTDGTVGDDGAPGTPGDGATGMGALQAALGFIAPSGGDGQTGFAAQGGGGGGGAKGGTGTGKCPSGMTGGASGGTGGAGGCGGQGGKGGKGGGASIGIVNLGGTLKFSDVTIVTKAGGKGGNGGMGQTGGPGGLGGKGGSKSAFINLNNACGGGAGGKGGNGGRGGGGRGGHSVGIAHTGMAPDTTGASITTGAAGNGGTGDGDTGTGSPGVSQKTQVF